jgi:23S rRNA (guanosine2251-2'-O)-methyltransferase
VKGWIYGTNPVAEALKSGRIIPPVYISKENRNIREFEQLAAGIGVSIVDKSFFSRFKGLTHQGVCAKVKECDYLPVGTLIKDAGGLDSPPLFVVVDSVSDPRNFGAIIRVADCAGANGVVFQPHGTSDVTAIVEKASSGAIEHVHMCRLPNIKHAMRSFKEHGIWVVGADADAKDLIWNIDLRVPVAFVFGSEGKGLRKTVRQECDFLARLPMLGQVESLNVSVAAGIFLFECLRQRGGGKTFST